MPRKKKASELEPFFVTLGQRIIAARERAGLMQRELAAKLSISASALSEVETGQHGIEVKRLAEIAEITGASGSWLLPSPVPEAHSIEQMSHRLAEIIGPKKLRLLLELRPEQLIREVNSIIGAHLSEPPRTPPAPRRKR